MRLHAIPHSTNVDRVELALALKGVTGVERVVHDPADRRALLELSGQNLVPVLEHDGEVLTESMDIVAWVDERHPAPPLWPAEPAARREVDGFITWFNHVWKVPPNAIQAALAQPGADAVTLARWAARLRASRHELEALLLGQDFLFGAAPGAADVCAYPFMKYATTRPGPDDRDGFHGVLTAHLDLEGGFPRLAAWIARLAALTPQGSLKLATPARS